MVLVSGATSLHQGGFEKGGGAQSSAIIGAGYNHDQFARSHGFSVTIDPGGDPPEGSSAISMGWRDGMAPHYRR